MGNALFDTAKGSSRSGSLSSLLLGCVVLFLLSDIPTKEVPSSSQDTTGEDDTGTNSGECFDGIDNDGDGNIDSQDFECSESNPEYDGTESGSGPPPGGP
jgi:hypothetical protein